MRNVRNISVNFARLSNFTVTYENLSFIFTLLTLTIILVEKFQVMFFLTCGFFYENIKYTNTIYHNHNFFYIFNTPFSSFPPVLHPLLLCHLPPLFLFFFCSSTVSSCISSCYNLTWFNLNIQRKNWNIKKRTIHLVKRNILNYLP